MTLQENLQMIERREPIVAAGTVVTKDVAPNTIVAGVSTREIRKIKNE